MQRCSISFPIYPHWIFERLRLAGYRPRDGSVRVKTVDVLCYTMRFTLQLPLKHAGITTRIICDVINLGTILHISECRIRKNLKWIGITIILNCVGLLALGK